MERMREWLDSGRLVQEATVIDGFEELPRALIRLFEGFNIGKLMVRTT
jgi:NADPH-dependent curcumin reductase CurA